MSAVPKPLPVAASRMRDPISSAELQRRWAAIVKDECLPQSVFEFLKRQSRS